MLYAADSRVPSGTDQVTDGKPAAPSSQSNGVGQALITKEKSAPEKNGIVREGGIVYLLKNGERQRVENDMHVEGLIVRSNGEITTKDGKSIDLKDGQHLTMEGQLVDDQKATQVGSAISTTTDSPAKGASNPPGQTSTTEPNSASPTGATRNMAPVRGQTSQGSTPADPNKSASGLTTPGASSGSSLGSGSNSTLNPTKTDEKPEATK